MDEDEDDEYEDDVNSDEDEGGDEVEEEGTYTEEVETDVKIEEEIKELELSELNVNVDEDVEITNDELVESVEEATVEDVDATVNVGSDDDDDIIVDDEEEGDIDDEDDDDATSEEDDDVEDDETCMDEEESSEDNVDERVSSEELCGKEVKDIEAILGVDKLALLVASVLDVNDSTAESEVMEGAVLDVVLLAGTNSCERTLSGRVVNAMRIVLHIDRLEAELFFLVGLQLAIP